MNINIAKAYIQSHFIRNKDNEGDLLPLTKRIPSTVRSQSHIERWRVIVQPGCHHMYSPHFVDRYITEDYSAELLCRECSGRWNTNVRYDREAVLPHGNAQLCHVYGDPFVVSFMLVNVIRIHPITITSRNELHRIDPFVVDYVDNSRLYEHHDTLRVTDRIGCYLRHRNYVRPRSLSFNRREGKQKDATSRSVPRDLYTKRFNS